MPQVIALLDAAIWSGLTLTLAGMVGGVIHDKITQRKRRNDC